MKRVRVIPVLLLKNGGLVKSIRFKKHIYVGDPINAVRIFNEKEVDEIAVIDISATKNSQKPNIQQISEITSEAFMPLAYGGGIKSIEEVKEILFQGVEKVILNSSALKDRSLVTEIAKQFGSQSVVISIDVKKDWRGKYKVYSDCGNRKTGIDPVDFAREMTKAGAGEIFLNSIDNDGTFSGFDIELVKLVANAVDIPVIACGGASSMGDFVEVVNEGNASAVAAGSMFVFQRPHRAVLISYPSQQKLKNELFSELL